MILLLNLNAASNCILNDLNTYLFDTNMNMKNFLQFYLILTTWQIEKSFLIKLLEFFL